MGFRKVSHQPWVEFSASNFRSIAELRVALPRFAVLVGPNSAGKTNLIDAMTLLGDMLSHRSVLPIRDHGWHDIIRRKAREARDLTLSASLHIATSRFFSRPFALGIKERRVLPQNIVISIEFVVRRKQEALGFVRQRLSILDDLGSTVLDVEVDAEGQASTRWSDLQLAESLLELAMGSRVLRQTMLGQMEIGFYDLEGENLPEGMHPYVVLSSSFMKRLEELLQIRRYRLDETSLRSDAAVSGRGVDALDSTGRGVALAVDRLRGSKKEPSEQFLPVLDALQRIYPRIEDIIPRRISKSRMTLEVKERGIAEPLDQANVSDGVLHALALYVALFQSRSGTIAVEEPENALHPWAIRALVEAIQNSPNRIIVTTHSEVVVNAIRDPDSLFIVEQGDDGTIVTPALKKEQALRSILSESGQGLGDIWVDGMLGGVP